MHHGKHGMSIHHDIRKLLTYIELLCIIKKTESIELQGIRGGQSSRRRMSCKTGGAYENR